MATRYPNAFFGYSGFVTAAPADGKSVATKGAAPSASRAGLSAPKANAPGAASRGRPQTKAA